MPVRRAECFALRDGGLAIVAGGLCARPNGRLEDGAGIKGIVDTERSIRREYNEKSVEP